MPGIGSDGVADGNKIGACFDPLPQLAAKAEGSSRAENWQGARGRSCILGLYHERSRWTKGSITNIVTPSAADDASAIKNTDIVSNKIIWLTWIPVYKGCDGSTVYPLPISSWLSTARRLKQTYVRASTIPHPKGWIGYLIEYCSIFR